MVRRQMNFKRLVLTDFKIDIPRLAKKKVLTAALEESGVPPCCLQNLLDIGFLLWTPMREQRNSTASALRRQVCCSAAALVTPDARPAVCLVTS